MRGCGQEDKDAQEHSLKEKKGDKRKFVRPKSFSKIVHPAVHTPCVLKHKTLVQMNSFLTHLLSCTNDANEAGRGANKHRAPAQIVLSPYTD